MTRTIFIFIASLLLLFPLVYAVGEISVQDQLLFCTPFLLILGIPHGAIDNVLYLRKKQDQNLRFIGIYLFVIALNVAVWLILPQLAYVLFLLLSAYHFGQSQFSHYLKKPKTKHLIIYLSWGLSVLSGLIFFNLHEIHLIMNDFSEFDQFRALHESNLMTGVFYSSTAITSLSLVLFTTKKLIKVETLVMESLVLVLILASFYLLPFIIGFSLYFVILHSLKVLREEYGFLIEEKDVKSVIGFTKLVAPFTLFSLFGIALLFGMIYFEIISLPYGYLLLIVISSITLPHVFVMNRFYDQLFSRKVFRKFI